MKDKIIFILLIFVLYYFNLMGRTNGLFLNFVIIGIINFILTYYLLKINPFKRMGLFLIFFPFLILTFTICYGIYMDLMMPGILDYMMYIISTSFGFLIYKKIKIKKLIILYLIIYLLSVYNYSNLMQLYYSTKEQNVNVNKFAPILNLEDKYGKKVSIKNENKIFVIDFWSLSCGNCIKSFPKFEKVKNDFKSDNVVELISINIYQSKDEIEKSEKIVKNYTFKNYYSDKSIFETLNFNSVPNYMIIGKDNRIKYFGHHNIESYENINNIYKLIENEK